MPDRLYQEFTSSEVRQIRMQLGGGDDRLEFTSVSTVTRPKELDIDLATGNDTFFATIGAVASNGRLLLSGRLGSGDDVATVVTGDVDGRLDVQLSGGDGSDRLALRATGDVSARATWSMAFSGEAGDDSLTSDLQGRLWGRAGLTFSGGRGNDVLGLSLVDEAANRGNRYRIDGGAGDDRVRVDFGDSDGVIGESWHRSVFVDGGTGRDVLRSPTDVVAVRVEGRESASSWQSFVDAAVQPILAQLPHLGVFVGIVGADGSREAYAFGKMNEAAVPTTTQTVWEIGSVTKTFTATLLADMVARGEVSLNDPVSRYLPSDAVVLRRGDREITLFELATHSSGLPRETPDMARKVAAVASDLELSGEPTPEHVEAMVTAELLRDWAQLRADLQEITLDDIAEPTPSYSNLGMGLLGFALATRLGTSYEEAIRQRVLGPLGLRDIFQEITPERESQIAAGHWLDNEEAPPILFDTLAGAGALRATGLDMLRYLEVQSGHFLSPLADAIASTHEPQKILLADENPPVSIGLSWFSVPNDTGQILQHGGTTWGFETQFVFNAETGTGFVVMINQWSETLSEENLLLVRNFLEALEAAIPASSDSVAPSAPPTVEVVWNSVTRTLHIQGTADADSVRVIQNDSLGLLEVTTSVGEAGPTIQTRYAIEAVATIRTELNQGDDDFEFVTRGVATRSMSLVVDTGGGNDTLVVRANTQTAAARLSIFARLGDGNDTARLELQNPSARNASIFATVFGEAGDDELNAFTMSDLYWNTTSSILLDGGAGNDTLKHVVRGQVNGYLRSLLFGGTGHDSLVFDAADATGSGWLMATAIGQSGNDQLVMRMPRTIRRWRGLVIGGGGQDQAWTDGAVTVLQAEPLTVQPVAIQFN
jgi:CubicO group peptidase (beta-lactamase class C family)